MYKISHICEPFFFFPDFLFIQAHHFPVFVRSALLTKERPRNPPHLPPPNFPTQLNHQPSSIVHRPSPPPPSRFCKQKKEIKKEREMAPAAKSAAFEKAVVESRKLKTKPTQDELLEVRIWIFSNFFFFVQREGRKEGSGERKGFEVDCC